MARGNEFNPLATELVKILEKEQFWNNYLVVVYLPNQWKRKGLKVRSQRSARERAPPGGVVW